MVHIRHCGYECNDEQGSSQSELSSLGKRQAEQSSTSRSEASLRPPSRGSSMKVTRSRRPRAWWSGRWDSNPRHSAWEADALPTELRPRYREPRAYADAHRSASDVRPRAQCGPEVSCHLVTVERSPNMEMISSHRCESPHGRGSASATCLPAPAPPTTTRPVRPQATSPEAARTRRPEQRHRHRSIDTPPSPRTDQGS